MKVTSCFIYPATVLISFHYSNTAYLDMIEPSSQEVKQVVEAAFSLNTINRCMNKCTRVTHLFVTIRLKVVFIALMDGVLQGVLI